MAGVISKIVSFFDLSRGLNALGVYKNLSTGGQPDSKLFQDLLATTFLKKYDNTDFQDVATFQDLIDRLENKVFTPENQPLLIGDGIGITEPTEENPYYTYTIEGGGKLIKDFIDVSGGGYYVGNIYTALQVNTYYRMNTLPSGEVGIPTIALPNIANDGDWVAVNDFTGDGFQVYNYAPPLDEPFYFGGSTVQGKTTAYFHYINDVWKLAFLVGVDIDISSKADTTYVDAQDTATLNSAKSYADTKQSALGFTPENIANKGVANGYTPLNSSTKIDSTYLPSYIDDIIEGYLLSGVFYSDSGHTTVITGETGKIYIDLTTGQSSKEYRWSGSIYIQITNGLIASTDDVTEGSINKYWTNARTLASVLTGFVSGAGTVLSTDTILQAFNKIVGNLGNYLLLSGGTLTGLLSLFKTKYESELNSTLTGSNQRITGFTKSNITFTNASLASIASIDATGVVDGQILYINNNTGNTINIIHDYASGTSGERIFVGNTGNMYVRDKGSLQLKYSTTTNGWTIVQSYGINGSGTTNFISKFNAGTQLTNSLLRDNGTTVGIGGTTSGYGFDLSAMTGFSAPFPILGSAGGGVPSSVALRGLNNGSTVGILEFYHPYSGGGNPLGWYEVLTKQNQTFTALATSGKSIGIATDTSMANSYSTPPTNIFNPEWRAFYLGTAHRAIGIYQGGGGYQFTKKEDGKTWAYAVALNSYLLDWDGAIIASTANGGKGNAGSQVAGALRSFNSRLKVSFMSNNNSPYYYVSGYVDVDSNGNCVTWYSEQDSTNTSALQAVITGGKLQFNGNVGDAVYVFVEKITGMYGNSYATWHTKLKFSADSQTQIWTGTGGLKLDGGLQIQSTGSNKRLVDATLVSGVVTVSNTSVTANTRFFPTYQTVSGTTGGLVKTAQVNGTSFTITSQVAGATNTADNSTITIMLIETY